jgi:5-methylcytosine-specific restriction endonuclease McrA
MARTKEQVREDKRLSMEIRRARDPEKHRAYQRERHAKNRAHNTAKMRAYYARRFFWGRAMKLRGTDRATYKDIAAIWKRQRGRCALTGRRLDRTADLDHIVPKTRGGQDDAGNLRWLAREVNMVKRNLTDAEFLLLCSDVVAFNEKAGFIARPSVFRT